MLRSKLPRPWQPRVSDSPAFNPFAHATESETSLSEQIEDVEGQVQTPADRPAAASRSDAVECDESPSSVTAEAPTGKRRWYASLVERFARH